MKKKMSFLRFFIFILWLMIVKNVAGFSQQDSEDNIFLLKRQLKFSLTPVVYNNIKFENIGKKILYSRHTFSGVVAILYYQHIVKNWGINTGLELSVIPQNLLIPYEISFDTISQTTIIGPKSPSPFISFFNYFNFTYEVPLSIEKMFSYNNKLFPFIEGGLKIKRLLFQHQQTYGSYISTGIPDKTYQFFEATIKTHNKLCFISYFIKTGLYKLIKKKNTISFGVIF